VVDAPADAWLAFGVVSGHRGISQRQARGGVVVGAAAQAGAATVSFGLVFGQGAAVHRGRVREQVGDATAHAIAAAAPLSPVVMERAIADGDHAGVQKPEAGGVVIPQEVKDAASRAEAGEDSSGAAGRVAAASAGLAVVQLAAADAGRTPQEIGQARAGPDPDQARDTGGARAVLPP